jgi:hypothetical protein
MLGKTVPQPKGNFLMELTDLPFHGSVLVLKIDKHEKVGFFAYRRVATLRLKPCSDYSLFEPFTYYVQRFYALSYVAGNGRVFRHNALRST